MPASMTCPPVREELEQSFLTAVAMTSKQVRIEGWSGPKAAMKLVEAAARRYVSGKTGGRR